MRKITRIHVTYDNGETEVFRGSGTLQRNHTHDKPGGEAPAPSDHSHDINYLSVTLRLSP